MLAQYPGKQLFENPNAPNVLLRVCLGLCGGLNDRLGQLPWDLYLANQTKRVFFIKWDRPKAFEHFLVPNEVNWSLPADARGFRDMKEVRAHKQLFEPYPDDRPEREFWDQQLDISLKRAISGEFKDIKVLRHRILGHLEEDELEKRLQALGETDMIHWTPSFGHLFWAFFKPSPGVQAQLDSVYKQIGLKPGRYSAVHCRVRHPKATPSNVYVKGKNEAYPADKTGLPWYGATRDFAVGIATKALYCARTLLIDNNEPLYLFSDSNDLVRYIAHELQDPQFVKHNRTLISDNPADAAALRAAQPIRIVAREMTKENAHIDRQKGRDPPEYYGTFVDFLLAANARCVTYGIGFYAIFATKISGVHCKLVYHEEEWGSNHKQKPWIKRAPRCTNETVRAIVS